MKLESKLQAQSITQRNDFRLREPFAAASHLFGALVGILGAAYLVWACDGTYLKVIASLIYGLALVTLFLVSGLFHGLNCSQASINKLERLDYAAIYLLIAGTYTPTCLSVLRGDLGLALLISEWSLALIGIWLALSRGPAHRIAQVVIFLVMGWAFVIVLPSLDRALSSLAFNLLILGGALYTIGAVIFAFNWPSLFRSRFSAHDCWHVIVLLASAAHYAFVVQVLS